MMKVLAVLTILSFSISGFATEKAKPAEKTTVEKSIKRKIASEEVKCTENPNEGFGIDPDYIEKQVSKAGSCYEASHIVESCGAGSSLDNMTTSAAIKVCDRLTGRLSKGDADLKRRMSARCSSVCNPQTDGTMCISQQAFCGLDVSKFMNSVNNR